MSLNRQTRRTRRRRVLLGLLASSATAAVLLFFFCKGQVSVGSISGPTASVPASAPKQAITVPSADGGSFPIPNDIEAGGDTAVRAIDIPAGAASARMITGRVRRRDTMASIFARHDIPAGTLDALLRDTRETFDLARINIGHVYTLWCRNGGELVGLTYELDAATYLLVERPDGEASPFRARIRSFPFQWEETTAVGTVSWSFFDAADNAGVPREAAMKFVELFSWDVDFHRDLRVGDSFSLLLRQKRLLGTDRRVDSEILAADFISQGHVFRAYRFRAEPGTGPEYFDDNGKSMRKEFLKAPLSFSRVSSRYSRSRMHPVLKKRMPHLGVDYAAPAGTPVMSTADGTVSLAGWTRGGGRTVKVRHNSSITTTYMHLSRFGPGIRKGVRVEQGQVIGYVGSTGLATGPHLDYRITIDGRNRDPLDVRFPPATAVPDNRMPEFMEVRDTLLKRLASGQHAMDTV